MIIIEGFSSSYICVFSLMDSVYSPGPPWRCFHVWIRGRAQTLKDPNVVTGGGRRGIKPSPLAIPLHLQGVEAPRCSVNQMDADKLI